MFSNMGDGALLAAQSEQSRNEFIKENEAYIISCASHFSKHYITKSDDEWSIALIAFSNAIDTYNSSKGTFQSYARLLIEHRLTDYFRSQARYSNEINTEPYVFEGSVDEDSDHAAYQVNVAVSASTTDENPIRDEILALTETLSHYDISFMELTTCSPKAEKTKKACQQIVAYIMDNPALISSMKSSQQLPIKIIIENVKVPRKIVERHRKYIITAVEILCGDFPELAEYLKI